MNDVLAFATYFGIGAVMVALLGRRYGTREARIFMMGYLFHGVAAIAQILITRYYYGGGDIFLYERQGQALLELVLSDPISYWDDVFYLFFRVEDELPIYLIGRGSTTGSMTALSAVLLFASGGSLYAAGFLAGALAFVGQVAIYTAFRPYLPEPYRFRTLVAVFFLPSAVFWTSSLLKEAFALFGLGLLILSITRLIFGRTQLVWVFVAILGFGFVASVKPYFLFPLAIAFPTWALATYWRSVRKVRERSVLRFAYLTAAALIAVFVLSQIGQAFPQFDVDNVSEAAADSRQAFERTRGGSNIDMVESSGGQTVLLVVFALVTSLFRPVIFEVHNATSLINGIEMFVLTLLIAYAVAKRGARGVVSEMRRAPILTFLFVVVCVTSLGIGLSSPNLGSLSRYRAPIMPLYCMFIVCLLPVRGSAIDGR